MSGDSCTRAKFGFVLRLDAAAKISITCADTHARRICGARKLKVGLGLPTKESPKRLAQIGMELSRDQESGGERVEPALYLLV